MGLVPEPKDHSIDKPTMRPVVGGAVAGAVVGFAWSLFGGLPPNAIFWFAGFGMLVGWLFPTGWKTIVYGTKF